jgi:hypothetical protein
MVKSEESASAEIVASAARKLRPLAAGVAFAWEARGRGACERERERV